MDRKELAIEYLKKALALSEEHNNIMDKTTLLIELSDCYAKEKQYHTAFAMLKQSTVLKDSIYKIDEEKRTKSLSTAYNEERALQEKLIQIENVHDVTMQKIYIITACVIIILLLRMDKLQAVKNEKENQKDTISLCPTKTRTDGTSRRKNYFFIK